MIWGATTFPNYDAATDSERLNSSYAAYAGRVIEPVMEPLGGDWRTGLALLVAFAAREVFVPALAIIMNVSDESGDGVTSLLDKMRLVTRADGSPLFTTASIIGLIIMFMIALQCMATVGVAVREFGGWKIPLIQLISFNLLAYIMALIVVQSLKAFGIA